MSGLRLTLRQPPPGRVDLSPLLPEWLAGLSPAAIAAIALPCGNRPLAAGDLFDIAAGDAADLVIIGGSDRLDQVGKGMTSGRITVEGEVGAYAGLAMTGGALRIAGKAGFAAAAIPARIAAPTSSAVRPSITSSSTDAAAGGSRVAVSPFRVGQ